MTAATLVITNLSNLSAAVSLAAVGIGVFTMACYYVIWWAMRSGDRQQVDAVRLDHHETVGTIPGDDLHRHSAARPAVTSITPT